MLPKIPIIRLADSMDLPLPRYADGIGTTLTLLAAVANPIKVAQGDFVTIPTGFICALPLGTEAQIRSLPNFSEDNPFVVINAPCTIDASNRDEIRVVIQNMGHTSVMIQRGQPIATLVFLPVLRIQWNELKKNEEEFKTHPSPTVDEQDNADTPVIDENDVMKADAPIAEEEAKIIEQTVPSEAPAIATPATEPAESEPKEEAVFVPHRHKTPMDSLMETPTDVGSYVKNNAAKEAPPPAEEPFQPEEEETVAPPPAEPFQPEEEETVAPPPAEPFQPEEEADAPLIEFPVEPEILDTVSTPEPTPAAPEPPMIQVPPEEQAPSSEQVPEPIIPTAPALQLTETEEETDTQTTAEPPTIEMPPDIGEESTTTAQEAETEEEALEEEPPIPEFLRKKKDGDV